MMLTKKRLVKITAGAALIGASAFLLGTNPADPTYFAEIDAGGTVLRVIVADQAFIDSGKVGPAKNWVQTTVDGSVRKNYAGKGYTYNKTLNAFVPPKTSSTATLDGATAKWVEPTPAISTAPTTTPQ